MNYGFETRCIHGNGTDEKTHSYGSVAVPIYQAATFAHPGIGQSTGYDYTRERVIRQEQSLSIRCRHWKVR